MSTVPALVPEILFLQCRHIQHHKPTIKLRNFLREEKKKKKSKSVARLELGTHSSMHLSPNHSATAVVAGFFANFIDLIHIIHDIVLFDPFGLTLGH